MLKPERIKEIEDYTAWGIESGIRGIGQDQYEVIRMLEDLLIERNHVILPAFLELIHDTRDIDLYGLDSDTKVLEFYCQRQWKTFG